MCRPKTVSYSLYAQRATEIKKNTRHSSFRVRIYGRFRRVSSNVFPSHVRDTNFRFIAVVVYSVELSLFKRPVHNPVTVTLAPPPPPTNWFRRDGSVFPAKSFSVTFAREQRERDGRRRIRPKPSSLPRGRSRYVRSYSRNCGTVLALNGSGRRTEVSGIIVGESEDIFAPSYL